MRDVYRGRPTRVYQHTRKRKQREKERYVYLSAFFFFQFFTILTEIHKWHW